MNLNTQYDNFAKDFSLNQDKGKNSNDFNRNLFYSYLEITPGQKILDLACGDGLDMVHYKELGAEVFGFDASNELLNIARQRLPDADLRQGLFEKLPYEDNFFNAVLSKYALMTSPDMKTAFEEILRVLKPGGTMMYLVVHPFRQYFERLDPNADYFEQTIVNSHILGNTVTVQEPTHTMGEYLNEFLFKNFDVQLFDERFDPAAEQINGRYPGFFILKAKKR